MKYIFKTLTFFVNLCVLFAIFSFSHYCKQGTLSISDIGLASGFTDAFWIIPRTIWFIVDGVSLINVYHIGGHAAFYDLGFFVGLGIFIIYFRKGLKDAELRDLEKKEKKISLEKRYAAVKENK